MRIGSSLAFALAAGFALAISASSALPFVPNDFATALGRAKSEKRPLFVESWAPW